MSEQALTIPQSAAPPAPPQKAEPLTLTQKAAIIISVLDPEAAGPLMERVSDKHMRALARAMAYLSEVSANVIDETIEEFVATLDRSDGSLKGGYKAARSLLARFVNDDTLARLMEDFEGSEGRSIWEKLDGADEGDLVSYINGLHPQAACIVLTRINPDKAASIINQLEDEKGRALFLRMSGPIQIDREALATLTQSIEKNFFEPLRKKGATRNPSEVIASLINGVSAQKRDAFIEYLMEEKPDVGAAVKKSMLSFPDLAERLPPSAVGAVARAAEQETLLIALKYGRQNAPSVVEFFFANLSKRMVQQYEESMEKLTSVTMKQAEGAQTEITSIIRQLADQGELELIEIASEGEEEEDYLD